MVVDSMTYTEIVDYLFNKGFSDKALIEECILPIERNNKKKYYRLINKWKSNYNRKGLYRIFKPILYGKGYSEQYWCVPFSSGKHLDYVFFTTFNYRNKKYLAFRTHTPLGAILFSWHSIKRYAERFLGDTDPIIDEVFIGDMLIYNTAYCMTEYTHNGKTSNMLVTTDGAFLCDIEGDVNIARTFISEKEYFENQSVLDAEMIETVIDYRKTRYGDPTDRNLPKPKTPLLNDFQLTAQLTDMFRA